MNVAFIPVRGGSKSIPLKNIKMINKRPLVYWTVRAAQKCRNIDCIYISTDSQEIRDTIEKFGFDKVKVISRSAGTATDTAATELAMLEFADKEEFDTIVLIQATSPLLSENDLDKGFDAFAGAGVDSVMSVVRQKRFIWKDTGKGIIIPANYDVYNRPRRQDFDGFLVENGAFYITGRENLLKSRNRVSGNIMAVEMDEGSYFEIDEPDDWIIVEKLLKEKYPNEAPVACTDIKLFLTDCDGCLTDGGMYYSENGDEIKKFNAKDGMGFQLLRERGILTGMITGESMGLNRRRADKLKLDFYEPGCTDKLKAVSDLCFRNGISLEEVAYVGDDINDLAVIKAVGFGCAVANACEAVKKAADYVTSRNGGEGAVREAADLVISSNYNRAVIGD